MTYDETGDFGHNLFAPEPLASTETKEALLLAVHARVRPPTGPESWVARKLRHADDTDNEMISVMRFSEAASRKRSGKIAQITIDESVGETGGSLRTTYEICTSPDGLQMRAVTKTTKPADKLEGGVSAMMGVIASGRLDFTDIQRQREAQDLERLLGLDTVTEQVANNLLNKINEAEPV